MKLLFINQLKIIIKEGFKMSKENALFKENAVSTKFFYILGLVFIIFGLTQQPLGELWEGLVTINTHTSSLVTDYIGLAGIGSAFVNAGLLVIYDAFIVRDDGWIKAGGLFAALLTCMGLGFMGKTIVASIPLTLGVYLHAKFTDKEFISVGTDALFITTLAPFVNLVAFGLGMNPVLGIIVAYIAGILFGFFLPFLAAKFASFHEGYSLYGYGFIAGVGGLMVVSMMKAYGVDPTVEGVTHEVSTLPVTIFIVVVLALIAVLGFYLANEPGSRYGSLIKNTSGKGAKTLLQDYGSGAVLINAGLVGLIGVCYVLLVGGNINGATISGIFTVTGFGAFGKTPKNIIPIMLGVFLTQWIAPEMDPSATGSLLAALYGTTLAPMSGEFGFVVGILAGMFHGAVVGNLGALHAGTNLYNNGFSGAFIATVLATILKNFMTPFSEKRAAETNK